MSTSEQIPWARPTFSNLEKEYVLDVIESQWISSGRYVAKLESQLVNLLNVKHALACSNGTTALQLALMALGIGPGDEVIVPNFTFVSPGNMVQAIGAKPIFVDISPSSFCISPEAVEKAITKNTKAIICVHVYGALAEVEALQKICSKYNIALIEDTAEAFYSHKNGRFAGTFGDIGCFSFHAAKTITMGEGGALVTNNSQLAAKIQLLRDQGMTPSRRYWHEIVGYNFRLTDLQAAVGVAQLEKLSELALMRKESFAYYKRKLGPIKGFSMQVIDEATEPLMWAVALKLDSNFFPKGRDSLIDYFKERGVETRPGFYPFTLLPPYKATQPCPVSETVSQQIICLPFYAGLSNSQIDRVCGLLADAVVS